MAHPATTKRGGDPDVKHKSHHEKSADEDGAQARTGLGGINGWL